MNAATMPLTVLLLAGVTHAALAQQTAPAEDDAIIVTATKREQNILDVPFSVNAQTQADLQRTSSFNIEDIARNVASLSVQNLGPGQSQVSVRGVSSGQIVRDQPGVKEQVGFYLDETVISLSLFNPDLDLFDLNRVETLRGPQGTLFGSGSVGGTIRYITNQPRIGVTEAVAEANINLVDEDDFGGHIKGAINVPLGAKAALRAVGYYTKYAGFIDALREGDDEKENVNDGYRAGGRLALRLEPGENLAITPRILYQKTVANGFNRQDEFNLYFNPFTTTRPAGEFEERQQYLLLEEKFEDETFIADLVVEADLGFAALTSVTSYTDRNILVSRDASALTGSVSVDLGFPDAGVLLPSNLRDTTEVQNVTQEIRLASTGDGPFQWVGGFFYAKTDRDYEQRLPTPGYDAVTDATLGAGTSASVYRDGLYGPDSPYNSDLPYDLRQWAIFGEVNWSLTDALTFTAGGRYYNYKEERSFDTGGLFSNLDSRTDDTSASGFNPRFIIDYKLSDTVRVNAQASRGFRLGGVNDPLNIPLCSDEDEEIFGSFQSFEDESIWNYEAGVKTQSRGFRANAAVFYTDIKNLQTTLDAGSCSSRIVFNVPSAHTFGFEFEAGVEVMDGLDLSVAGNWVQSEFDSTVVDGNGNIIGGIEKGNRLPSVPPFQISVNATYTMPITDERNAFFSATFQHIGNRYTQPSDQVDNPRSFVSGLPFGGASGDDATVLDLNLPAYQLVNLSVGYDIAAKTNLTFYVTNLLDENAKLSFDRERGGRARLGYQVLQPRTIGLTLRQTY